MISQEYNSGFSDQTGRTRVRVTISINFRKGLNLTWKKNKKEPKGQTKILGPTSVIWDQNS